MLSKSVNRSVSDALFEKTFLENFRVNSHMCFYPCMCWQLLTSCLPLDKRVMAKMKEVIESGVHRVPDIQRHIRDFVCNDLFAGQPAPSRCDARYWPSTRAIKNCTYKVRHKLRFSFCIFWIKSVGCKFFAAKSRQKMSYLHRICGCSCSNTKELNPSCRCKTITLLLHWVTSRFFN